MQTAGCDVSHLIGACAWSYPNWSCVSIYSASAIRTQSTRPAYSFLAADSTDWQADVSFPIIRWQLNDWDRIAPIRLSTSNVLGDLDWADRSSSGAV